MNESPMKLGDLIDNPESVEPSNFGVVPKGMYEAIVTDTEIKENSKGTGYYLKTSHKLLDEKYAGKTIDRYFNIRIASAKAQTIAQAELCTLFQACGFPHIQADEKKLIDRVHILAVNVEQSEGINPKNGEPWNPKNVIDGFYKKGDIKVEPTKKPAAVNGKAAPVDADEMPDFMK